MPLRTCASTDCCVALRSAALHSDEEVPDEGGVAGYQGAALVRATGGYRSQRHRRKRRVLKLGGEVYRAED